MSRSFLELPTEVVVEIFAHAAFEDTGVSLCWWVLQYCLINRQAYRVVSGNKSALIRRIATLYFPRPLEVSGVLASDLTVAMLNSFRLMTEEVDAKLKCIEMMFTLRGTDLSELASKYFQVQGWRSNLISGLFAWERLNRLRSGLASGTRTNRWWTSAPEVILPSHPHAALDREVEYVKVLDVKHVLALRHTAMMLKDLFLEIHDTQSLPDAVTWATDGNGAPVIQHPEQAIWYFLESRLSNENIRDVVDRSRLQQWLGDDYQRLYFTRNLMKTMISFTTTAAFNAIAKDPGSQAWKQTHHGRLQLALSDRILDETSDWDFFLANSTEAVDRLRHTETPADLKTLRSLMDSFIVPSV